SFYLPPYLPPIGLMGCRLFWIRAKRTSEPSFHRIARFLVHLRQDVSIGLEGDRDVDEAEHPGNHDGGQLVEQQERGSGVTQVMRPDIGQSSVQGTRAVWRQADASIA